MNILPDLRVGNAQSFLNIDTNGHLVLVGNATVWDDLFVPLTTSRQGATSKPDFDYTNLAYLFPNNDATEILYFFVQLPHRWREGSTAYPHLHWLQAANQVCGWKMDYQWTNIGAAPGGFVTLALDSVLKTYTSGTLHQINYASAGISGAGKTLSSIIQIKLYRDDSTYTGDASALQFDLHLEIDTLGSNTEYNK